MITIKNATIIIASVLLTTSAHGMFTKSGLTRLVRFQMMQRVGVRYFHTTPVNTHNFYRTGGETWTEAQSERVLKSQKELADKILQLRLEVVRKQKIHDFLTHNSDLGPSENQLTCLSLMQENMPDRGIVELITAWDAKQDSKE